MTQSLLQHLNRLAVMGFAAMVVLGTASAQAPLSATDIAPGKTRTVWTALAEFNLRAGRGTQYPIARKLHPGESFTILTEGNHFEPEEWIPVLVGGKPAGYARASAMMINARSAEQ